MAGRDALEFRAHGRFALVHHGFVVSADHEQVGIVLTDAVHIHARHAFQRQDAFDAALQEPGDQRLHKAVRID